MKIGLVQQTSGSWNQEVNLAKALAGIKKAAEKGASIVCLQELFTLPYFPTERDNQKNFSFAESIPGPTTVALSKAAREHQVVLIGGSIFEKSNDAYYNTSIVFSDEGKLIGTYRKNHIPNDPQFWEKSYFKPGEGYEVFETKQGKIGVLICYDQWFPEAARIVAQKGAQFIFYPTAIGWTKSMKKEEPQSADNWILMQRSHAIANHAFVAAVNRVGKENTLEFWGRSFIADPHGKILHEASSTDEEVIVVECDINKIEIAKQWGFMANRRPETYGGLTK